MVSRAGRYAAGGISALVPVSVGYMELGLCDLVRLSWRGGWWPRRACCISRVLILHRGWGSC